MISISRLLLRNLVIAIFLLCAVWSAGFFLYTWSAFTQQFDSTLADEVATIIELTELNEANADQPALPDGTRFELEFRNLVAPESEVLTNARYFQLWDASGGVVARSASLEDTELEAPAAATTTPSFRDITLPGGKLLRAATVQFLPRLDSQLEQQDFQRTSAHMLMLVMARSRAPLEEMWASLVQGFLLLAFLLPIGTVLVVRKAVRHGLTPLTHIANEISNVDASTLASRLSSTSVPEELRPVVARLNSLFARLDTAFQREKRLTADVAHELRTPIAELRILAEVRLQTQALDADARHDYQAVLDIAMQMEHQAGVLLALARSEGKTMPVTLEEVDFGAMIQKSWSAQLEAAQARDLTAHFELPDHAAVYSDRALLGAVLTNLFSNAVAYSPRGGAIRCDVHPQNGHFEFRLVNDTDQLSADELEHVFEPFWRKDAARSATGHAGLGLTLAQSYSTLLKLHLQAFQPEPGVFAVTLSAPGGVGASNLG